MEFYSPRQYENIADRLRRLAADSAGPVEAKDESAATTASSLPQPRDNQPSARREVRAVGRLKTEVSTRGSVPNNQERVRTSMGEVEPQPADKSLIERVSQTLMGYRQKDQCVTQDEPVKVQSFDVSLGNNPDPSALGRARSDSYLKVEQLLKTYRNYKQNRQEFAQSVQKTAPVEGQQQQSRHVAKDVGSNLPQEQATSPQFERSRPVTTSRTNFEEITDQLNYRAAAPYDLHRVDAMIRTRPKRADNAGRMVQQRSLNRTQTRPAPPVTQTEAVSTLSRMMLSPRAGRVAGKICRNREKTSQIAL